MDARTPTQNTQSVAQPDSSVETVVAEQPSVQKAMDPTQAPVGLRGGGEGEDICCGL
ncbi:hypothetical protein LTR10_022738 [Elasticomyces elasticus]|uniref:Uncharacterized protein n=1 Tax=Exophiala sideris TaxID=1016849 RepID=A0ABR0JA24_9EURO|nr:hypothetical protein LTR10_022738 [Elasticomyces elasticus]KAK5026126.1 hypothetical protein LTS07_007651 [Exophiala sideris]KAK5032380.1 hypothetical protein LTR13_007203 [Exophiala sideris]KAK5059536.1 hypothetical protein LTR69_006125 [Exophiala sideris]KAK5186698.1 hypothetical protein LTR44_000704 [Eurotiomycetes sp. CCFEE 6388]